MKQKFCINSTATFKQINSSPNNKSKTKETFSFAKCPRFEKIKPICKESTYGGDFVQHKLEGTKLGKGMRSDFTKCLTVSPSSTKYEFVSEFERNKLKKKGNTMGLNRESVVLNQYIDKEKVKNPPSTKYQYENFNKLKSPSFSFGKRTKIQERARSIDPETENPGPGIYSTSLHEKVSKFHHSAAWISKIKRFQSSENKIPGVGQYQSDIQLQGIVKHANSKFKKQAQIKFPISKRNTYFDTAVKGQKGKPGPGKYKIGSEFGEYDGDVYENRK